MNDEAARQLIHATLKDAVDYIVVAENEYVVYINTGRDVTFQQLSVLSELFKTRKINLHGDAGFVGSDVTGSTADEWYITIERVRWSPFL